MPTNSTSSFLRGKKKMLLLKEDIMKQCSSLEWQLELKDCSLQKKFTIDKTCLQKRTLMLLKKLKIRSKKLGNKWFYPYQTTSHSSSLPNLSGIKCVLPLMGNILPLLVRLAKPYPTFIPGSLTSEKPPWPLISLPWLDWMWYPRLQC